MLSSSSGASLFRRLHADVVGSTTLVQQDEAVAHDRMQSAFRHFSQTIDSYGGIVRHIHIKDCDLEILAEVGRLGITRVSVRARGAPGQKWMPSP